MLVQMQDRHAAEAQGGAGGPAGLTKEIIFGRIAAYEIAFGNRPNGRSSPTFIGYFSRDEIVLMGFMGLNEVTDPARLTAYHKMEARLTAQQVPATPRFHGVCDNCKVYGHQARECTATRRPEGSSKGSANGGGRGGQQGVQPGGKGGGGKGDAGGRGRGRAVAAVNQAAPGSQPFVMTDAQFNRWMTAQGK